MVVDLAGVEAGSEPEVQAACVAHSTEENKDAVIKAGSSRGKGALRDFRKEFVSLEKAADGNEPQEAEYIIREAEMKQATE